MAKPNQERILPVEKSYIKKGQIEVLPRIKIHSEPNEKPSGVADLLAKMKEE